MWIKKISKLWDWFTKRGIYPMQCLRLKDVNELGWIKALENLKKEVIDHEALTSSSSKRS